MKYSKEEEFQLIKTILQGRQELFRELVDRYAPMVFYIVRGFEQDEAEVEELAQEIFVKAYEKLGSFDMRSRFSSWLYMLAKNHCRDYVKNIRRQNKRFSEMEEHRLESELAGGTAPDELIEEQQWKELLQAGLKKISSDYAQAFLMKYQDEMTYEAMSEQLDVSISALKVRVHRGRKQLLEYMKNRI